jgi:hypothetical protein
MPGLFMAVREGFEPSIRFRIHTFQACSFNHSDTSPNLLFARAGKNGRNSSLVTAVLQAGYCLARRSLTVSEVTGTVLR